MDMTYTAILLDVASTGESRITSHLHHTSTVLPRAAQFSAAWYPGMRLYYIVGTGLRPWPGRQETIGISCVSLALSLM